MRALTLQRRYVRLLPVVAALIVATAVTTVFAFFVLPEDDDPGVQAPSELDGGEVSQLLSSPESTEPGETRAPETGATSTTRSATEIPRATRSATPALTSTPASTPTPAPSPTRRPPSAANNLVTNGGFNNRLQGWYYEGQVDYVATSGRNNGPAIRLGPSAGYADEELTLEVGKTYRLQAWGKIAAIGQTSIVGIQYWDANGNRLENIEPTPLTFDQSTTARKALQFTFPDNVARVHVYLWNQGGLAVLTVDDVSVREIIDPGDETENAEATAIG